MEGERKIHMSEGVPLNAPGAANIFLNTAKNMKVNSPDGTVIHFKTEKPSDLGVHINTTFSMASSKKLKLLFVLNFLLSLLGMIVCCCIAFYYWSEMISMRRELDLLKDHYLLQNQNKIDNTLQSALVRHPTRPGAEARESRMEKSPLDLAQNAKRYYVEDLGEDMLLVDSKKKNTTGDNAPVPNLSIIHKDLLVAQFNGAMPEYNIGKESIIGPWELDTDVSSKNSEDMIQLNNDYVTIKDSGLYLVYAQVVYLTRAPNCYFIWATTGKTPRQLTTCATGDDSSSRPIEKSQISCSVQTVARLNKGDIVNISQREHNRTLWLRPGFSYFGFVKLSS